MRTVLMNWVHPDDATAYYGLSPEEQHADVERHIEWFRKHRDHIVGGEELDEPAKVKTLRPGRQGEGVVVTDGPYIEAKELLGGFVILETDTLEEAVAIASDWPSLTSQARATVQLHPVFVRE
ncbi:MAG TPA: YciI family protein [Candidatus Limnocylindria bacterium]|nr:YciI family protein [Candidatus Limnocylindria bacterium]